jgi:UPF0716 protein FxsA
MPIVALLALFILVPLAELYVILKVGDAIGAVPTILLLAADSVLGSLLLRAQGRAVWRRFNAVLSEGRMPHRELIDGVLVIFGGAFLITPGFLSDILGALLLLPPTRAVFRRLLIGWFGRRFLVARVAGGAASMGGRRMRGRGRGPAGTAARPGRRGTPYDFEGEAVDLDPPPHLSR